MTNGKTDKAGKAGALSGKKRLADPKTQQIVIRDLTLSCSIGLSEDERARQQRLRLNLELEVQPKLPREDGIAEVVDYSGIVRRVRAACRESRVRLVETLAGAVAEACFEDKRVKAVTLRIEKLDRYADIGGIGVEMQFSRRRT